ncbi:MAG: class I SAM-dependent methyltransferase [Candidatus Eisenbacteria bacterium]|uniref:Class I SAM-dependent methyltransferase n=1 Tax=Eiseniibacteriota bacterium TaxID=2212470 RepID=A0A948WCC1_UNCEI|nr:class I SAM-dependent methyltransferase [Candidatus Eisenbacteria bacterium]MBU1949134.1 class I SAM-dependent methyltransferase [Candidatus Eisenbacteria bacterium]MBU2690788.1 class I SAM-dependent methyltransferase [Candidatus Eisenbacteria bacterium]
MASIEIQDVGSRRKVRLMDPVFYNGSWHPEGISFDSSYRRETLEALYAAKIDFLYDEILRVDDDGYLRDQFISFVRRQTSLKNKKILDFGCGCGSSSILLSREGAIVTGVDPHEGNRRAARLRIEDEGLGGLVDIPDVSVMDDLPFEEASFDLITLSAVLEHIHPQERHSILNHLWDRLQPGGMLIITETPNRIWPFDGHTTRLPFVHWLPLSMACSSARLIRPVEFRNKSTERLIADGIVGSTWRGVVRSLPNEARPAPTDSVQEHHAYFERIRGRKKGVTRAIVEALSLLFLPCAYLMDRGAGNRPPITAILPYLNIAFKKPMG